MNGRSAIRSVVNIADGAGLLLSCFQKDGAGFSDLKTSLNKQAQCLDIHEMGGVRMRKDPKTSLLNEWNELDACKNIFVTGVACMTSKSTQNPSLTYMTLGQKLLIMSWN